MIKKKENYCKFRVDEEGTPRFVEGNPELCTNFLNPDKNDDLKAKPDKEDYTIKVEK